MKRIVFVFILLPVSCFAQMLKYQTDTLKLADTSVIIRRSTKQQLEDFKLLGSKAHGISMRLVKLQQQLDEIKEVIYNDGEIYTYYLTNAQSLYMDIKSFYAKYPLPEYEAEINFYKYLQAKQEAEEENVH